MADRLTTATATKYVRDYFAGCNGGQLTRPAAIIRTERRTDCGLIMINVHFVHWGRRGMFSVWLEPTKNGNTRKLYGEW
jgi:hypothetical protein